MHAACDSCPKDVIETLQPVINLLESIIHRLQLKGDTYDAADDDDAFWKTLEQIDEMQTLVV